MTDSIQQLARRIAQTRPIDRAAKLALAQELRSARGRMYPSAGQDSVDRLEAAAMLMMFLAGADQVPAEALQIVARLTASLDERLFAAPVVALPEPAGPALDASSRLGEILVAMGIVTMPQLEEGLRMQGAWRLPLGTCLEKLGFATNAQIARGLEAQQRLRAANMPPPLPTPSGIRPLGLGAHHTTAIPAPGLGGPPSAHAAPRLELRERSSGTQSLGELFVEQAGLSRDQLDRALLVQRATGMSLGECLIELGLVSREQVKQILQVHERRQGDERRWGGSR